MTATGWGRSCHSLARPRPSDSLATGNPQADARLDGDEMAADADDGNAGHAMGT
jgi:hypothetical protein